MPADLAKVKELFLAVLELPATKREAYLDTVCAGNEDLRRRLDAMLQSHQNSGELLPRSPADMLADTDGTETDGTAAFAAQPAPSATQVDQAAAETDDLAFLSPSEKPGHLGRLGHYEVQEVIGRGGFGIVLKAFDERLHRVVAIKVLSPAYAANGAARRRFIREARAAAAVKNEHVVGIHDVQEDAQPPYLVMEFIDGIALQDKIDKVGSLGVKEILRIGMQIAEGLAAAHRQGLVHRDIKPANILLENGVERVKITDFGLARAVDDASVTQSGTVAGTPMYMSPEQAEGLAVDHRSDLFSLGTVLYAMCTGHPPFRASGTHAVLKRVIDASPRPIHEINNEIPDWLCAIIAKLHGKKPEERFQTAKEVADLLGQNLAHVQQPEKVKRPVSVVHAGKTPTPRPVRDRRIAAVALVAFGIVILAAAIMLANLPRDRIFPNGAQWLVAILGQAFLLAGVFLGFRSPRSRFLGTLALLIVFGCFWFNPTVIRNLTNRGDVEIVPQPGLTGVIILQNDVMVTDWLDMRTNHAESLSPGKYTLNAGSKPEFQILGWELTTSRLLDNRTIHQAGPSCELDIHGGERVTIRVLTREDPDKPAVDAPDSKGWVQLFNGKDLSGWRVVGMPQISWQIRNGMLWGGGGQTLLVSDRKFTNFHLKAEVRISPGGAGSVVFRSDPTDDAMLARSFSSVAVRMKQDLSEFGGSQLNIQLLADGQPKKGVPFSRPFKADEWIVLDIIANGDDVTAKYIGKEFESVRSLRDFQRRSPSGPIILELGRGKGSLEFRKIEIKELPPDEPGAETGKKPNTPRIIRFDPAKDIPIRADGITPEDGGWKILANTSASVEGRYRRLFELHDLEVENCKVTLRGQMKTATADFPGMVAQLQLEAHTQVLTRTQPKPAFFSSKLSEPPATGSTAWAPYEVSTKFFGRPPALNVNLYSDYGPGTVWLKDLELVIERLAEKDRLPVDQLKPPFLGPARSVRRFAPPKDGFISLDDVTTTETGWKISFPTYRKRTLRLFELRDHGLSEGTLILRVRMKSVIDPGFYMTAYPILELRPQDSGEGKKNNVVATSPMKAYHNSNWAWYEVRVPMLKAPEVIALALSMDGVGTVWIEDIELLHVAPKGK